MLAYGMISFQIWRTDDDLWKLIQKGKKINNSIRNAKDHFPTLSTRERKLINLYFGERILQLPSTVVILKNKTLFHGGILLCNKNVKSNIGMLWKEK